MAGEIFISYRRADQDKARLLHALLKQRGVDAWYDALVGAGEDWRHKTAHALDAAPIFVLLFSKVASESDDISKELAAATFSKKLVIPVRIDDIKPQGAFLYELASRNWFDAFKDTEARFEVLADQLAALVKGGPAAEVAAFSLGAPAAPVVKPAAKPLLRQPAVLGGIALAAVALVAAIAFFATRAPAAQAAAQNERTAFFGFSAAGADPLVTEIAANATEETFTALAAAQVETAARGDTLGVKLEDQLARAEKLGARYALEGSVQGSGEKVTVTIRLDDTKLRATLWQTTLTGSAAQRESLPVQAAFKGSSVLQCLIVVRPDIEREDAAALAVITRACEPASGFDPQGLTPWHDVVRVAPKSAYAAGMSGASWVFQAATAPAAERTAMLAQSRSAFERAKALDPADPAARAGMALANTDLSLAQLMEELNAALAVGAARSSTRNMANATTYRIAFLVAVGRNAEAVRVGRTDAAADLQNGSLQTAYTAALLGSGQMLEGRRVMDDLNRKMADPSNWARYALNGMFSFDGDLPALLKSIPPGVSPETVACVQAVDKAVSSKDAAARKAGARRIAECIRAGNIQPGIGVIAIAGLGDADNAFAFLDRLLDRSNPVAFIQIGSSLFTGPAAPLRADPRFLPLVKKVGIYQYWLDTRTQPDVCETPEERDIEVCVALRKDQGK